MHKSFLTHERNLYYIEHIPGFWIRSYLKIYLKSIKIQIDRVKLEVMYYYFNPLHF